MAIGTDFVVVAVAVETAAAAAAAGTVPTTAWEP